MTTFTDLGIEADLVEALASKGIIEPFPIQEQTIPLALSGQDIIGRQPLLLLVAERQGVLCSFPRFLLENRHPIRWGVPQVVDSPVLDVLPQALVQDVPPDPFAAVGDLPAGGALRRVVGVVAPLAQGP